MAFITCPECNRSMSEKARVCVRCGCPLAEEKPVKVEMPKFPKYQLNRGQDKSCFLASFLRVMTVITIVGGLIAAIAFGIIVGFTAGLIYLVSFAVIAIFTAAFAQLAEEIHETHYMLYTLEIVDTSEEKEEKSSYRLRVTESPAAGAEREQELPPQLWQNETRWRNDL